MRRATRLIRCIPGIDKFAAYEISLRTRANFRSIPPLGEEAAACHLMRMYSNTHAGTPEETLEVREKLLSALKPSERELIKRLMDQHPLLTMAEAIERTAEMGGIGLTTHEAYRLVGSTF